MRARHALFWLLCAVALATGCRGASPPAPAPRSGSGLSVAEALGGKNAGYLRATEPRAFVFPDDHGPHDGFRTEWWYFTGNLADAEGRRYGFQLTFFRQALTPDPAERESAWGASHLVFAHFAVGDESGGRFHARERFSREALGLAGAQARPFRVWIDDWRAEAADAEDAFPMRLRAAEEGVELDLVVTPAKPPVLQGEQGLSRKGAAPGNASYYYSFTRLDARGTLAVDGAPVAVSGLAWMDREWSTSVLGNEQTGWDWFAIQLEDGRDLMLFQLRRRDGSRDPFDAGALVDRNGRAEILDASDFTLLPRRFWENAAGVRYPVAWSIELPGHGLRLETEPLLDDQELAVTLRYWEGAIEVSGRDEAGGISGRGFLEMTGYDEASGFAR